MRLIRHSNFKVQRFQLFEQIKKDDCDPRSTAPHLPLSLKKDVLLLSSQKVQTPAAVTAKVLAILLCRKAAFNC